ncbi:MAG: hypothetical protein JWN70_5584 [Planctomycetaceae bacterium]|nr:hypothetical protein [Planctomycetaceae bacterium]
MRKGPEMSISGPCCLDRHAQLAYSLFEKGARINPHCEGQLLEVANHITVSPGSQVIEEQSVNIAADEAD